MHVFAANLTPNAAGLEVRLQGIISAQQAGTTYVFFFDYKVPLTLNPVNGVTDTRVLTAAAPNPGTLALTFFGTPPPDGDFIKLVATGIMEPQLRAAVVDPGDDHGEREGARDAKGEVVDRAGLHALDSQGRVFRRGDERVPGILPLVVGGVIAIGASGELAGGRELQQRSVDGGRCGDDRTARQPRVGVAVPVGDDPTGLADDERRGGDVPRPELELEESVEDAFADPAQVEAGGPDPPNVLELLQRRLEHGEELGQQVLAPEREPGRDDRLFGRSAG